MRLAGVWIALSRKPPKIRPRSISTPQIAPLVISDVEMAVFILP